MYKILEQFNFILMILLIITSTVESKNKKSYSPPIVHVLGDSHSFEFIKVPGCVVHWLGPITMHRVGRDGLSFLNLLDHGVLDEQVVIFAFGEIDVRFHILKQRDIYKRDLEEILDTLTENYFATILTNKNLYKNLFCIVYSITPPLESLKNLLPHFGLIEERVEITKQFNKKLEEKCKEVGIAFLDVFDDYSNADGTLNIALSDNNVHINNDCYQPIYNKLKTILEKFQVALQSKN